MNWFNAATISSPQDAVRTVTGLLAFFAAVCADAQSLGAMPPSDLDLRSAYCMPVAETFLRRLQDVEQQTRALPASDGRNRFLTAVHAQAVERQSEADRLRAYVIPKVAAMSEVNSLSGMTALAAARQRGVEDVSHLDAVARQCYSACLKSGADDLMRCSEDCSAVDPAIKRARSCHPVDWLPF